MLIFFQVRNIGMNMKSLGVLILWLGFLSGALATVWSAPAKGIEFSRTLMEKELVESNEKQDAKHLKDGWHLINWSWYGVSVAVAIGGIVMIRVGKSEAAQKSDKTEASLEEIKSSLRQIVVNVRQLEKDSKSLAPSQILSRIDDDLADDLMVFADGRESITAEYGLAVYADVMTHFAAGERSVNRAWCAAADGYVNEAETCLERASIMFTNADKDLQAASSGAVA